ncbi:DUF4265 domain-containing protein [Cellulomonas sp. SG140]|uniref:DUF4265 domain-containing protein n=1 Tax=Cellulomonas sp. SG140 TaxID=2976536 RepID=UPI0021E9998C|nr:DUF4265 domain-containing protein [Cellulomonas sp. SG140]
MAVDSANSKVNSEQLWARRLDDLCFELCCIPFFAYDIALGDIVETDERFTITRVSVPSGRYVFRAYFGESYYPRDIMAQELESRGALIEWSSTNLLAIDAKDHSHAAELAAYLQEHEDLGHLMYETGRSS